MSERDPYVAIMVAAARDRGLHLSADEIQALAIDDAIMMAAYNKLHEDQQEIVRQNGWKGIRP